MSAPMPDPDQNDVASAAPVPSVRRLKKRREFLAVADTRVRWTAPGLTLQAGPRPVPSEAGAPDQAGVIGVGFTVSKKVGNSVARNRARRRLRAAAALVMARAGRPGTDYVLIGRRETLDRPFADLVGDVELAVARVVKARPSSGRPPGRRK